MKYSNFSGNSTISFVMVLLGVSLRGFLEHSDTESSLMKSCWLVCCSGIVNGIIFWWF